MNCQFCGRLLNPKGFSHVKLCKFNPDRKVLDRKKEKNPMFGKAGNNQFTLAKQNNAPIPIVSRETRDKIGLANKDKIRSRETRDNLSVAMKLAVQKYPESYSSSNVNGRTKKIQYNGFTMDGSWELKVAKWLDNYSIKWEKPVTGFSYEWNGTHTYYPDFYLLDYGFYIEVKGYERQRDIEKWKAVKNLIVFKHLEISKVDLNINPSELCHFIPEL